ncbi:response regulator [Methylobacterium nigriterrae]|uniref:response regulator n=1 Tax=Methylobacterium nigriterrae TaxID=3127512 RepID=UPI003013D103
MTRCAADLRATAFVDEAVAFELNAAAAYFERQGQRAVAEALREQAEALLADAGLLAAQAEAAPRRAAAGETPTILVVEDEAALLKVVAAELQDAGFNVLPATTYEGADALLTSPTTIDLLLTDIRLPDRFTGWDVAERARSRFPGLPVIYVTGYSVEEPRPVDNSLLLMKPCRPSALITAMQQLGVTSPP